MYKNFKGKLIFTLIFSFFILMCFNSQSIKADRIQDYGNKIFESPDRTVVLISVSDNATLGMYSTYEFYLFNSDCKNLSIKLNQTEIDRKTPKENALIGEFFVNATQFDLNIYSIDNKTLYISVHYISEKGIVPIHHNDKNKITKHINELPKPEMPIYLLLDNVIGIVILGIVFSIPLFIIVIKLVIHYKEHGIVEGEFIPQRDYYSHNKNKSKGD